MQGNILDLIFSEANSQLRMSNCQVENYISNHAIITTDTNIIKRRPPLISKLIRYKSKLTKENMQPNFKEPTIEGHLGAHSRIWSIHHSIAKHGGQHSPSQRNKISR